MQNLFSLDISWIFETGFISRDSLRNFERLALFKVMVYPAQILAGVELGCNFVKSLFASSTLLPGHLPEKYLG